MKPIRHLTQRKPEKRTQEERVRERCRIFEGIQILDTHILSYSPLHWILRNRPVQALFSHVDWRVYTYIVLRAGPEGYYVIETSTITRDLGYPAGRNRRVTPSLDRLSELGFITIKEHESEQYIAVPNPVGVVRELIKLGKFSDEDIAEIAGDCFANRAAVFGGESRREDPADEADDSESCLDVTIDGKAGSSTSSPSGTQARELDWADIGGDGGGEGEETCRKCEGDHQRRE